MPIIQFGGNNAGDALQGLGQGVQAGFSMGMAREKLDLAERQQTLKENVFDTEQEALEAAQAERDAEKTYGKLKAFEDAVGIPEDLQGEALEQAKRFASKLGTPVGFAAQTALGLIQEATPSQREVFGAMSPEAQDKWLLKAAEDSMLRAQHQRMAQGLNRLQAYAAQGVLDEQVVADARIRIQSGEDFQEVYGELSQQAQERQQLMAWGKDAQKVASLGEQLGGMDSEILMDLTLKVGSGELTARTAMAAIQAGMHNPSEEDLATLQAAFDEIDARSGVRRKQGGLSPQASVENMLREGGQAQAEGADAEAAAKSGETEQASQVEIVPLDELGEDVWRKAYEITGGKHLNDLTLEQARELHQHFLDSGMDLSDPGANAAIAGNMGRIGGEVKKEDASRDTGGSASPLRALRNNVGILADDKRSNAQERNREGWRLKALYDDAKTQSDARGKGDSGDKLDLRQKLEKLASDFYETYGFYPEWWDKELRKEPDQSFKQKPAQNK